MTGNVDKDEFYQHLCEVATTYPNDEAFVSGISKIWNVVEDEDAGLDNIRVMHLLSLMRQRLLTKANS